MPAFAFYSSSPCIYATANPFGSLQLLFVTARSDEELERCSSCEVKLSHIAKDYCTEVMPRILNVFEIFTIF
jgi:uncharacterized protein with PIN domain